jgi:hypothetical protein
LNDFELFKEAMSMSLEILGLIRNTQFLIDICKLLEFLGDADYLTRTFGFDGEISLQPGLYLNLLGLQFGYVTTRGSSVSQPRASKVGKRVLSPHFLY